MPVRSKTARSRYAKAAVFIAFLPWFGCSEGQAQDQGPDLERLYMIFGWYNTATICAKKHDVFTYQQVDGIASWLKDFVDRKGFTQRQRDLAWSAAIENAAEHPTDASCDGARGFLAEVLPGGFFMGDPNRKSPF